MNVNTITVSQDTAVRKIADLKALKKSQRTAEDDALLSLYTSVAKHGARVLTLAAAFRQAGLNEKGQPRIAIAQGHWSHVMFASRGESRSGHTPDGWRYFYRSGKFWEKGKASDGATTINLVNDVLPEFHQPRILSTPVPYVPANVRPKFHLRNYHILFEVSEWTAEMPVDPFLLKRITGDTYAVLAEWDLTPLEASILGSMRSGN